MEAIEVDPAFAVSDERALRAMYQEKTSLAALKVQRSLDVHARAFIARSPFLCIGTQDLAGFADVSPRGDPVGFVKVLDAHTLAIPDRIGNNQLDSLGNILVNPSVGLLFVIPGFDDTLRVSNVPSAPYAGGGVDAAGGCTPSGDQAVECRAVHVRRIRVTAGDKPDRVKNLTGLRSTIYGEGGKDLLIGGRNDDNLFGGPGADVLRGMDGNDFLHTRDSASEDGVNCDGGSSPGDADQADLDSWPQDPNPRGCELRTRR